MSSHFRIKYGETEIEFEGSAEEVSAKFKESFEWLKSMPMKPPVKGEQKGGKLESIVAGEQKQGKGSGRGGARSAVVGPAMDELIKEGFFDDFKGLDQVTEELKRKKVPIGSAQTVDAALGRRVPRVLDRIKNEKGNWVYRKKP
jgi:hypothetical protein